MKLKTFLMAGAMSAVASVATAECAFENEVELRSLSAGFEAWNAVTDAWAECGNVQAELNLISLIGTNVPSFNPWYLLKKESVPLLRAAGIKLWRWPGGSVGNNWCPTTKSSGESWDACFNRFPAWREFGQYPTPTSTTHLSRFIEFCRDAGCEPMVRPRL